jgi:predicted metal-dependent phosphotriesterase family hydrolase
MLYRYETDSRENVMSAQLGNTAEHESAAAAAPQAISDASEIVRDVRQSRTRWSAAAVEMAATVGLALSTLVAITAVSIGIARADVLAVPADADGAPVAIALFIGLLLSGMGGLTALMAQDRTPRG